MYISIRNQKGFPQEDFDMISNFLLRDDFKKHVQNDYVNKDDEQTRVIITVSDHLFLVRHTEFTVADLHSLNDIHVSTVERYGFIDLYQIGTDVNKNSILYWAIVPKAKIVVPTYIGIVCSNTIDQTKPRVLARFDHLWIAGSKNSTVLTIDQGSSHLVT